MTLDQLTTELFAHVRDEWLRDNYFKTWINDAILGIATDFDLPALERIEPFNQPTLASTWLVDMPEIFCKRVSKCRNVAWNKVHVLDCMADLDVLDEDHNETGTAITHIAVNQERRKLGYYPKAADTARLWFFDKPPVLDQPNDPLTCIPEAYQRRVVIPKAILIAYPHLQDMGVQTPHPSLAFWHGEYSKGLYGSPKGDIGMVHYLATLRPIRVHLGRQHLP